MKNLMLAAFIVLLILYPLIGVLAYLGTDKLIFQPQQTALKTSGHPNLILDFPQLTTPNGEKISTSFYENKIAEYTIIYSHGNAEDIPSISAYLSELASIGFNVLAYDYRGYGTSEGKPSEKNAYEDIETVYNFLVIEKKIPPEKIIIFGRSLGGAISIDLASRRKCGGLIVESSFISAFRVLTRIPIYPFDKFESIHKINKVNCPILFIHGKKDSLIPSWHSEKLFAMANEPKTLYLIENADHNDVSEIGGKDYYEAIQKFSASLSQ